MPQQVGSDRFGDLWIEQMGGRVVAQAQDFVAAHGVGIEQRELLEQALGDMRVHRTPPGMYLPSVHLPLLVVAGIRGEGDDPIGLALCTALLELGMDVLDHVADREIGERWRGWSPESIQIAAIALFTALAPIAIAELPLPGKRIALLHARLAKGLMAIAGSISTSSSPRAVPRIWTGASARTPARPASAGPCMPSWPPSRHDPAVANAGPRAAPAVRPRAGPVPPSGRLP